jgi:hypothetical protein
LLQQLEKQARFGGSVISFCKSDALREKHLLQPLLRGTRKLCPQPLCVHNDALREITIQQEKSLPIVKELAKEGEAAIKSTPRTSLAGH